MALTTDSLVLAADFNQLYTDLDTERVRHQLSENNSQVISGSEAKATDAQTLNNQINDTFLNSKFVNTATYSFDNSKTGDIMKAGLLTVYNSAFNVLKTACINFSNNVSDCSSYSSGYTTNYGNNNVYSNKTAYQTSNYSRHSTSCQNYGVDTQDHSNYSNQSNNNNNSSNTGLCGHLSGYNGNNTGCYGDNHGNWPNNWSDRANYTDKNYSTSCSGYNSGCGANWSGDYDANYSDRSGYCNNSSGGSCSGNHSNRGSNNSNYSNKSGYVPGVNK